MHNINWNNNFKGLELGTSKFFNRLSNPNYSQLQIPVPWEAPPKFAAILEPPKFCFGV